VQKFVINGTRIAIDTIAAEYESGRGAVIDSDNTRERVTYLGAKYSFLQRFDDGIFLITFL